MTSVLDVLREHHLAADEMQVVRELRILLDAETAASSTLTSDEDTFLAEYAGVPAASKRKLATLAARTGARVVLEAAEGLSRAAVADLLGVDETRVSHRARAGTLYSYAGASGRPRYPSWQFVDRKPLPHLAAILAGIPAGTHPVTLHTFVTTPDDALWLNDCPVSPIAWLTAGGDPDPVAQLAATLGEQL